MKSIDLDDLGAAFDDPNEPSLDTLAQFYRDYPRLKGSTDLGTVLVKGSLLMLLTGEYSDKQYDGPFKVLRTMSKLDMARAFLTYHAMQGSDDHSGDPPSASEFTAFLVRANIVELLIADYWHVGDYEFSP
jgi:hypothetical protein